MTTRLPDSVITALTVMYNAFPQSQATNFDAVLFGITDACKDYEPGAIVAAAQRFTHGSVEGQSRKYAPSLPEFVAEVKECNAIRAPSARPAIEPPQHRPDFETDKQRWKRQGHQHINMIMADFDQETGFRSMPMGPEREAMAQKRIGEYTRRTGGLFGGDHEKPVSE